MENWIFGINRYSNYILTIHPGWEDQYIGIQVSYYTLIIGGMVNLHKADDDQ